jgi:hypothetical protein
MHLRAVCRTDRLHHLACSVLQSTGTPYNVCRHLCTLVQAPGTAETGCTPTRGNLFGKTLSSRQPPQKRLHARQTCGVMFGIGCSPVPLSTGKQRGCAFNAQDPRSTVRVDGFDTGPVRLPQSLFLRSCYPPPPFRSPRRDALFGLE